MSDSESSRPAGSAEPGTLAANSRPSLPGDLSPAELVERIIRVDHAGEFGARRIYEGQLAVLKNHPDAAIIRHMHEQELAHLQAFEKLMVQRRVRPSALHPIWNIAGFALGVEEVIDEHYQQQQAQLGTDEAPLKATIERFRTEEIQHRNIGLQRGAEEATGYPLLTSAIKAGSRLAIWLAERV